jgi:TIGR03009 family protein
MEDKSTKCEDKPMRKAAITFTLGLFLVGVPLAAQQQPPQAPANQQPAPDPAALMQQLETVLGVWENMLPTSQTVYAEFRAIRKYNSTTGMIKTFNGQTKFMRLPDGTIGAKVFLQEIDKTTGQPIPNKYELVICTGRDVYFVDPKEKIVYFQELPGAKVGQVPDQGPLAFLFGMKKVDAKRRYALEVKKFDQWYTYVDVKPVFPQDKREFIYARLAVLNQALMAQGNKTAIPAFMPRQLYWVEPDQNENTWEISYIRHNAPDKVARGDFLKPQMPADWKLKKMETAPPPAAMGGAGGQAQPPNVVRN